jgi:outer membrane immunogenic protein
MNNINSASKLNLASADRQKLKLGKLGGVALAAAALLTGSYCTPVLAADILAPNGHDWSGIYVGTFAGVSASDSLLEDAYCRNNIDGADPENPPCGDEFPELFGARGDGNAITFGGLIGYNLQLNSGLVIGLESDLGFGGGGKGPFESSVFGLQSFDKGEIDVGLAGSTRFRAGYALDRWLPYVTGGIAYAKYDAKQTREAAAENRFGDGSFVGWTAGAGLNYAATDNIIFGLEYRYTDYRNDTLLLLSDSDPDTNSYEASLKQHEIRTSIAYALGATGRTSDTQDKDDWSGLYVGAFGGLASLDGIDDNAFCRLNLGECGGNTYGAPVDGKAPAFGGLVGYNHSFASGLVLGAEADLGVGGKAKGGFVSGDGITTFEQVAKVDVGLNGSARLRAGYAAGEWLPFVTAGLAYARYNVTTTGPSLEENRFSNGNLLGWTAGAGLNYAVASGIIVGAEYRYTDYGSDTHLYYSSTDGELWSQDVDLKQHEVRASLAYQF